MIFISSCGHVCSVHGLFELLPAGAELLSEELMETLMTLLNQRGAVRAPAAAGSKG